MTKDETIKKLIILNNELTKKLKNEIIKNSIKDEVCIQQSKMAAMGEMIGNIAHQWRQPLMELSSTLMLLNSKIEFLGSVSNDEIIETIEKSDKITKYMSNTIDDFKNFFAKDKKKVQFKISDEIKRVVNILSNTLNDKNIKVNVIIKSNPIILGYKNEYSQVLLNIISNAKDALVDRNIENGLIEVKVFQENNNCITLISDNANGIKDEYINEIFKPFFTQDKSNGTGIGLFISKIIIENNMNGKLLVENHLKGARFSVIIPLVS